MNSIQKLLEKKVLIYSENNLYYGILTKLEEHANYFNIELLNCREIDNIYDNDSMIKLAKYIRSNKFNTNDYYDDSMIEHESEIYITINRKSKIYECQRNDLHQIEIFPTSKKFRNED